jgi:hypothetical protein
MKKSVDKVCDFDLELILEIVIHVAKHTSEFIVISEANHLHATNVLLVLLLFNIHELYVLFKVHKLAFHTLKDVV